MTNSMDELEQAMKAAILGLETNLDIPEETNLELKIKNEQITLKLDPKLEPTITHTTTLKKVIAEAEKQKQEIQSQRRKEAMEACDTVAGAALVEEIKG